MAEKSHCGGCSGGGCGGGHTHEEQEEKLATHPLTSMQAVYALIGGKGGMGKSTIAALLAAKDAAKGKKVGILDADITNPTVHKLFDVPQGVTRDEGGLYPALTQSGIQLMGMGFLAEEDADIITTKSPVMAGIVRQFFTDVCWQDLDVLYIDLPSTLSDVVEQALSQMPLDGLILINNPGAIAKAANLRVKNLIATHEIPITREIENFGADIAYSEVLFQAADSGDIEAFATNTLVDKL